LNPQEIQNLYNSGSNHINSGSNHNYSWSNGESNEMILVAPNQTTTYYVTVTDTNGCVATDSVNVTVNALPNVDAGTDLAVCDGDSITLNGSGADSYVWSNGVTDATSFIPSATTSGSSLNFDGNDDYLELGDLGNHWNSTFEMWFKPSQDINGSLSQEQYLFSKDGDNLWTYRIGILTDGRIGLGINGTDNNGQWVYTNNDTWSSNNWYHIAVSMEDDGGFTGTELKIYINGQLKNSAMWYWPVQSNSYPTFVGTGVYGNDRWFNGNMSDIRVWDVVRSQVEIQNNLYTSSFSSPNLIGHWGLDEGSGTTSFDKTSNNNDAIDLIFHN